MEISTAQLAWLAYHRAAAPLDHYRHFSIPKKSGGKRSISSPLVEAARGAKLAAAECVDTRSLHEAAVAFRPGINITDNARRHAGG
jgi:hypothetical protein